MSGVNYLEKLLDGVEVHWKTLGQACNIETGKLNANAAVDGGAYMFFTTAKETSKIDKYRWDTEALLIAGNANVGEVKHYIGKFDAYQRTYVLTNFLKNVNVRFLFFVLGNGLKKYLEERTNSAAMTYIVLSTLENFPIPIPCPDNPKKSLEIQAEIVRILDAFTSLTAELTAELTARIKQYNYYRDQLLSFEEGDVEWKTLGGLVEVNTGSKPSEILENATSFDYINAGTSRSGYSAASNCEGDTVTTPSRGQGGIGFVGYQRKPFWLGPLCYKLQSTDKAVLINKYLFYFLQSRSELLLGLKKEGGVPAVNKSDLVQLEIPVPSVEEQKRIVAILDKFDALTHSITEGLPREIELRQKQYAYYRDLLLSFPKEASHAT